MPILSIYIDQENFDKLQKVENKSGLIRSLLTNYFQRDFKPDKKEVIENLEKAQADVDKLSEIKEKIEVEEHIKELSEKEKIEKEIKKLSNKCESIRKSASSFFPNFSQLNSDSQDKLIDEYLNNNPDDFNLVQFFNLKGFQDNLQDD